MLNTNPFDAVDKTTVPLAGKRSLFGDWSGVEHRLTTIALIGNFAPRQCGIATFTADAFEQLRQFHSEIAVQVYALDDRNDSLDYQNVEAIIVRDDPQAFEKAAECINASNVDAVWLQHEYGIFGGLHGEMVCDFVDRLAPPLILTLHTVLVAPTDKQRSIIEHLVARASRVMVMNSHSRELLATLYGCPHELIEVIEHGAPDRPFGREEEFKARLGLEGKKVVMTFGLLGPGKGLEQVIEAMPAILDRHPDTIYRIVGATHPNLVRQQGEHYRETLAARADALDVSHAIEWVDRFLDTDELLDQLEACDVFITPYFNLQQSTSGTLSYAVALGKAVVATPYVHARDLLAGQVGMLIEPQSPAAIAEAINYLFDTPDELAAMKTRAYLRGRSTIWKRFAGRIADMIAHAVVPQGCEAPLSPPPGLTAVFAMSDSTGMLQHAIGIVPDRDHGYCLDDNVRALMLMNRAAALTEAERHRWSLRYASFIQHAWDSSAGVFRNFMGFDRRWLEDRGSDDSNGRAIWTLGQTALTAPNKDLRDWAGRLFDEALAAFGAIRSPRAIAFAMLGATSMLRTKPDHGISREFVAKGAAFLSARLQYAQKPGWNWFEDTLAYDNARLCQALIEGGSILEQDEFVLDGIETLNWLCSRQTSVDGTFRPIGSHGFAMQHASLPFDQQPLEAQATIEAAYSAWLQDGDDLWFDHARNAWRWFFGFNDRGAILVDYQTGLCRDGVNPRGVNENSGAESNLAFQHAYYSMLAFTSARFGAAKGTVLEPGTHHVGYAIPDS